MELHGIVAHLQGDKYQVMYECGKKTTWPATVFAATLISHIPEKATPMIIKWFSPHEVNELNLDAFTAAALSDLGVLNII